MEVICRVTGDMEVLTDSFKVVQDKGVNCYRIALKMDSASLRRNARVALPHILALLR
jgi:hypothetical protein